MAESKWATQAREDAQAECDAAWAITPIPYQKFIVYIPQRKRVGGTRDKPEFVWIKLPYMKVDGRVAMARDQHAMQGATLDMDVSFTAGSESELPMCKATIKSSMLGSAVGHCRVNVGGTGVDASNPFENAETSACGRALGFLGYGLFGGGIASAEEVLGALDQQRQDGESQAGSQVGERATSFFDQQAAAHQARERETPNMSAPAPVAESAHEPASPKQRGYLYGLLEKRGVHDPKALYENVYMDGATKQNLMADIDELTKDESLKLPAKWLGGYVLMLRTAANLGPTNILTWCNDNFEVSKIRDLSAEQQSQLFGWLLNKIQPASADGDDDIPETFETPAAATDESTSDEPEKSQFMVMVERMALSIGHEPADMESWIVAEYGDGEQTLDDIMRDDVGKEILKMDTPDIKAKLEAFLSPTPAE